MSKPKHDDDLIGITVNQHLSIQQKKYAPTASGAFTNLLTEIIVAAKVIRNRVTLAGIAEVIGSTSEKNVQGETVQILDRIANETMIKRLKNCGSVSVIVSEEDEEPIFPETTSGEYAVAIDPLDGSSNIACNIPIGTIFGIWKTPENFDRNKLSLNFFKGRKQVAAGYILYGPSSMLVYSTGNGVHGFTYDPSVGEFILTHENMKFPELSKCYSVNEAYWHNWSKPIQDYITWVKTPDKETGRPYGGRYVGSLVADFHRNLLYGGIFLYPPDKRTNQGKLRLLYEASPLSFLAEQAGGLGSTGTENILDVIPTEYHQRVPLYIGNKRDVELIESFIRKDREKN